VEEKVTTIIFDLGGVLINWDPKVLYRKIFETEAEVTTFLREVATMDWNEQQDGGRSLSDATALLISQYPQWTSEIEAYYTRWEEMLVGPIDGTVEILRQLKTEGNYRLLALTNWSAETFPIAQKRYDFLEWFEGILVSGQEKLKKPDPAIYQLILKRYKLKSEESIFIDDNLRNIEAARALGIQSIHFATPNRLIEQLSEVGVLLKSN